MAEVSFVIPFRTDKGRREELFNWNVDRLTALFPRFEVIISDSDKDKPFNLSQARNNGIREARGRYIANVDSDTVWDPNIIFLCLDAMTNGAHWVIPYTKYRALTGEETFHLLKCDPEYVLDPGSLEYEYVKDAEDGDIYPPVSGLTFLRRDDLIEIGGFDEEYNQWGWEDRAFAVMADRIIGHHARLHGDVYHMWHPRGDSDVHQPYYHQNWRRFDDTVAGVLQPQKYL